MPPLKPTDRVAVIGAGALGLTAALRLAERGHRVVVMEREPLPGGLAAGFELAHGVWLEKFYHHIFRSDRFIISLIEELGLGDDLVWHRVPTVSYRDAKLHQLDSPMSLLRFSPLRLPDRIRMGLALAYLRVIRSSEQLEGQTAAAWIRRRMGRAAYDTVWGPLLRGKFGHRADEIAMPWFWARVHDRTPELGYPAGGFQRLYARLDERVRAGGGETRYGAAVTRIGPSGGGVEVEAGEAVEEFDAVVSTLPTGLTCRLTPTLPGEYVARHAWGEAFGAHCLILELDRPLTDAYWINVTDPGFPFMVMVEHTNMRPPAEYGGRHLVYLGNYRPMSDPLLPLGRDEVLAEFLPHLARIVPGFSPSWVVGSHVFVAPWAQPIVTAEYRSHIPPFETPLPGLFVANMFQVYPHDRGQNYSVELAERLVAHLTGPR